MSTLSSMIIFFVTFTALTVSVDRQRLKAIQNWLVEIWVKIEDDGFVHNFSAVNKRLFAACVEFRRLLTVVLISVFVTLALIVPLRVYLNSDSEENVLYFTENYNKFALVELELELAKFAHEPGAACAAVTRSAPDPLSIYIAKRANFEQGVRSLAEGSGFTDFIKPLAIFLAITSLAILLVCSFRISTAIILRILKTDPQAGRSILVHILTGCLSALLIPTFIITIFYSILELILVIWHIDTFSIVYNTNANFRGLLIFEYIYQLNCISLAFRYVAILIYAVCLGFFSLIGEFFTSIASAMLVLMKVTFRSISVIYANPSDVLSIDYVMTMFNWCICLSVLFSLSYFLPSFLIISVSRSSELRRMLSNAIQYSAEHPNGPLIAISAGLTGVIQLFR